MRRRLLVGLIAVAASTAGVTAIALDHGSASCSSNCNGNTPLGPCGLAFGSPTPAGSPGNRSYDILVEPNAAEHWGSLKFFLSNQNGAPVASDQHWHLLVYGASSSAREAVAEYLLATNSWTNGSSVLITSGQTAALDLGSTDVTGLGYHLVAGGPISCGGDQAEVSVSLP
jgi:hypothetical protein